VRRQKALPSTAAEGLDAAQDIGLPVVVKPSDANHGPGVSVDLKHPRTGQGVFLPSPNPTAYVMVELCTRPRTPPAETGGRVVAAARGESYDNGDGKQTVSGN
jgi:cyanophycin synthetase